MFFKQLRRAVVLTVATAVTVFAVGSPASAHVHVDSDDATAGGYAKLVFRVPTESDTASTTKVEVALPQTNPFTSVSTEPVPGWTVAKTATSITWTANATSAIAPEQFQEFPVSVGPIPENTSSIAFPTIQTYSDGEVVRWTEVQAEGQAEPEHPAPLLEVSAADASDDHHATTTDADESGDDSSNTLGVIGIVLGAIGILIGLAALEIARGARRS